jgi:hypothetical protein
MRLFSLMAMQSKPTITHRQEIKRHLEMVMHSLMMLHNPRDVAVWASDWVDEGLLMGAGRPKVDFTLGIANTAHGLMRRATSITYWMQKWVSPQNPEVAEDCLPVFKDFLADIIQGVKGIESAPGVDTFWSDTAVKVNFDNVGDEETFRNVAKAFVATHSVEVRQNPGGGRGRDRNERSVFDSSATTQRCDAKHCDGMRKHGVANATCPEMLKRNPHIKLCVACHVAMLRDGVDVVTNNNGTIKHRAPTKAKAKFGQLRVGKGVPALRTHYAHARDCAKSSERREFIEEELSKISTKHWKPESGNARDSNKMPEEVEEDDSESIVARLARLELGHSGSEEADKTLRAKAGNSNEMRKRMIEEWMRCNTEAPSSGEGGDAKEVSDELTLFHPRKAKKI